MLQYCTQNSGDSLLSCTDERLRMEPLVLAQPRSHLELDQAIDPAGLPTEGTVSILVYQSGSVSSQS